MRVNDPNLNPASLNTTSTGKTGQSGSIQLDAIKISSSSQSGKGADHADEVELSQLSGAINALQSDSPQRTALLEGLKADVASGNYQADAAETSKKLVDDLLRPNQ